MIYDLVIKNAKVYLNGTFQPCDVAVSGETISMRGAVGKRVAGGT